ncbi:MAG: hypothetical protein JWO06_1355 [Bacteroidota bacterium]|nr:hypothetical protein [Bacteroidota bacterium]
MIYKVFWTPEAEATLNQNILYLEYEWTDSVIEDFINKTEEAINTVKANPLLYPLINKKKGIHKCLVVKQSFFILSGHRKQDLPYNLLE